LPRACDAVTVRGPPCASAPWLFPPHEQSHVWTAFVERRQAAEQRRRFAGWAAVPGFAGARRARGFPPVEVRFVVAAGRAGTAAA
jgi:hypothetical protein